MPGSTVDLLFRFLHQNEGRFSKRAREGEFRDLTAEERERIETLYAESFDETVE
jgi:predicted aminopeptidase